MSKVCVGIVLLWEVLWGLEIQDTFSLSWWTSSSSSSGEQSRSLGAVGMVRPAWKLWHVLL